MPGKGFKTQPQKETSNKLSVSYMGHIFSAQGLAADLDKVKAVSQMQCPTDVQGVQRVLGVANYLAKFTPKLSTVCEPLRHLLDKDSVFDWLPQHETAFSRIKELITQAPVLQYYDVNKEVLLECDSSEVGLGAVIKQGGHPIVYASRALTKTECNYAQIEKECLLIVFAAERFEQHILGQEKVKVFLQLQTTEGYTVETHPHKPKATANKCGFDFRNTLWTWSTNQDHRCISVTHYHGPHCQPLRTKPPYSKYRSSQKSLNWKITTSSLTTRLARIKEETGQDTTLLALIEITEKRLASWQKRQSTQCHGILALPWWTSHRKWPGLSRHTPHHTDTTEARDGRQGTQVPLRHPIHPKYCPWNNVLATDACGNHWSCPVLWNLPAHPTTATMTTSDVLPSTDSPMQFVASDCFEINGRHYVVLVDIYSDFIELSQLPDLNSNTLIKAIKPVFATHSAPANLITDNGTNFISSEFCRFLKSCDVNHITSSPHHHQSNGRVEAAVKLMKGIIKKSTKEGTDMWKAILEWRNATTPGMRSSPMQWLLSKRTHSMLPCKATDYTPQVQMNVQQVLIKKRQTTKSYYDWHAKQLLDLTIEQPIRVKRHPQTPNSDWMPGIVTSKAAPRSYMVQVDGQQYRRNSTGETGETHANRPLFLTEHQLSLWISAPGN